MFQQSISVAAIVAKLRELSQEKHTGTLYVIDNGHLLGHIGLQKGEIVSLMAQKKQGLDAIPILLGVSNGSIAFAESTAPPARIPLPPTADILALLQSPRPVTEPSTSSQQSAQLPLTSNAKDVLELTIKEFIGPIAKMICADLFRDVNTLAAAIDALANEIPNPGEVAQFRERVHQRLR